MAWRQIHDNSASSESLAQCSLLAHGFFAHLTFVADMWGRGRDNPRWILSRMFEVREDVSEVMLTEWMDQWEAAGLIVRYTVSGRYYFQIAHFDRWQPETARNRKKYVQGSRFPAPPGYVDEVVEPMADLPEDVREIGGGSSDNLPEDVREKSGPNNKQKQQTETANREQNAGTADAVQPPAPRPRLRDVPQAVRDEAEQYIGRPLSDGDGRHLVGFVFVEQYPTEWILRGFDEELKREKPTRSLAYVAKMLARWKREGGPDQPRAPRQRAETTSPEPEGPPSPIVDDLIEAGIGSKTARELAEQHTEQRIREQLQWLPMREGLKNPVASLVKAIREGWEPPAEVLAERRAEKQREVYRRDLERRTKERDLAESRAKRVAEYRANLTAEEAADLRVEAETRARANPFWVESLAKTLIESAVRAIVAERLGLPAVEFA